MEIDYSSDLLTYVCYCDYERLEKLIYSDDFKEKYDRKLINLALDVSICSAIAWTDRGWCDSVIHMGTSNNIYYLFFKGQKFPF
jgi:hypothetical protein